MTQKNAVKQAGSRVKPFLMIVAFVITLFLLVGGIMSASDWNRIRPYKELAAELNDTLGGGYKTSYTWKCQLETTNCPSALMTKSISKMSEDEVAAKLIELKSKMGADRFELKATGECKLAENYGYCRVEFKDRDTGLIVIISPRKESVFIDIQS